jgi:hypothetical protein
MESDPGSALEEVWVYLSPAEAAELLVALEDRANDQSPDPDWHLHLTDSAGRELTIAIESDGATRHSHRS